MQLICGILSFDNDLLSGDLLAPMCDALQSPTRPAKVSTWSDGHAALAVLDFSAQPSVSSPEIAVNSSFALAGDLRLDNQLELQQILGLHAATDASTALAAAERWGVDSADHLLGDFAFACFDRNRRTLTLARDIFGVRPLAYHHQPGRHVVFASLPRGLFPSGLVPREVDPLSIGRLMQFRFPALDTPFRGIRMVLPAHTVVFSRTGERPRRYWRPRAQPCTHKHPADAAEELRSLLNAAVRSRIPQSGTVASHLSGGIDSSTLCGFASRALLQQSPARPLHAFTFQPAEKPGFNVDYERPFVQSFMDMHPSVLLHAIPGEATKSRLSANTQPDRILSISDTEPDNAVCKLAAELGADTILSGAGGDEGATFNGRGVLAQSLLNLRWGYLAHELRALSQSRGWSLKQTFTHEVLRYFVPGPLLHLKHRLKHGKRPFHEHWRDLLQPRIAHAIGGEKADTEVWSKPSARRNQLNLLKSDHVAYNTLKWATHAAHYGVAFAFPMLDRRVVEFTLSLPAHWHLRDGIKRRVIRDATYNVLPELIRWRNNKFLPQPQLLIELPERRQDVIARITELATHPSVQNVFRTEQLLALAASIPTLDQALTTHRSISPHILVTLLHAIPCCNFLIANEGKN